ncbi:hypothetical protein ACWCSD_44225, partial [Nonomuraea sp. NPDC001684]
MTAALWQAARAEWDKLWSVRSTWWCLAGAAALMVLTAVALAAAAATDAVPRQLEQVDEGGDQPLLPDHERARRVGDRGDP